MNRGRSAAGRAVSIEAVVTGALADLQLVASGKVREMYAIEDDILMVASDRISAYDVVLPTPIPDKGAVLTRMSVFWFETTGQICPNHMISDDVPAEAEGRGLRVKRLDDVPGRVRRARLPLRLRAGASTATPGRSAGSSCPTGLTESAKLPEPIFTPATKADVGDHDENISFERAVEVIGDRSLMEIAARHVDRPLRARGGARGRARDHHRRHEVRVRRPRRAPRSSWATRC